MSEVPSAARCKWLCRWLTRAPLSEPYRMPFNDPHYLNAIKEPMDLHTLGQFAAGSSFTFDEYRRMMVLIWSNALAYNAADGVFHRAATVMKGLVEDELARIMRHPHDHASARIRSVCGPMLSRLRQDDAAAALPEPISHAEHMIWKCVCTPSLSTIVDDLDAYVSGDDVDADVRRFFRNVLSLHDVDSSSGKAATKLSEIWSRLWARCAPDLTEHPFVTLQMRQALEDRLKDVATVTSSRQVARLVHLLDCSDLDAVVRHDDCSTVHPDALSVRDFYRLDRAVRRSQVRTTPTPSLVGIAGHARMGKDTFGASLASALGMQRRAFADAVGEVVATTFETTHDVARLTAAVSDALHKLAWIECAMRDPCGVFCDVRFRDEVRALRDRNGVTVLVARPSAIVSDATFSESALRSVTTWFLAQTEGKQYGLFRREDLLAQCGAGQPWSEPPDDAKLFDWYVRNDGTLDDARRMAENLAWEIV